jgi:superfamily II DNA or RNA helicase
MLRVTLDTVKPDYEIPSDDLVGEVLIPAMQCAQEVRIGSGFFSSHCFAQIAPGLAAFLAHDGPLRLLASTELSAEDRDAIERGVTEPQLVIERFAIQLLEDASSCLTAHTADCLACLVAQNRLQVRFVLMPSGMYHKKLWLFRDGDIWLAVHGSGNATARGLLVNGEQMTIDRPWKDGESSRLRVGRFIDQFDRQWHNRHSHSLTIEPLQMLDLLKRRASTIAPPTVSDFWDAWRIDHDNGKEPALPPGVSGPPDRKMRVPSWLDWHAPPYSHQATAIDCLEQAGGSGILAIATGGGKTRIALIAATRIQNRLARPVLLVVLVPSRPLALQWQEDVRDFGVEPVQLSGSTPSERSRMLEDVAASLHAGCRTEVLISSNQLFAQNEELRAFTEKASTHCTTVLIGDEVHNLGAPTFADNPPSGFGYRIGLSATPIRQYDASGTDKLFAYFSAEHSRESPVFTFTLEQAIAVGCLVPYRYWVHCVPFTAAEMNRYEELTQELRAAGFGLDDDGQVVLNAKVERLLRERRALIEQAEGKIPALEAVLQALGPRDLRRALVYTSAKAVRSPHSGRQIDHVTELLSDLGIVSHQFTNAETSRSDANSLLEKFGRGDYQVLSAMKVLDEGIDIPQTNVAFLLASSTVEREWVQRRGRILRRCDGKDVADLHDFLVLPPNPDSDDGRRLLRSELRRVEQFGRIAVNEYDPGGPVEIIRRIESGNWS